MTAFIQQIRTGKPRRRHAAAPSLLGGGKKNAGFGEVAAEYKEKLRAQGNKAHSIDTTMGHVRKWGAWLDTQGLGLRDVRDLHLDKYVNHRREVDRVGETCLRRDVMYAKAVLKFACRRDYVYRNRLENYDLPKVDEADRKMPTPQEGDALLRAIQQKNRPETNPCMRHRHDDHACRFYAARDQAIVAIGIGTGLRISEILALYLEDYDRANRQLSVRHSKTGKARYVAFEDVLLPYIDAWLRERPDELTLRDLPWFKGDDAWRKPVRPTLFVSEGGRQMLQNCWGRQFGRYCAIAGVEGITFHCLRHYHLSLIGDISVKAVMAQGGHSTLEAAQKYQHKNANAQRAAVLTAAPMGQVLAVGKPKRRQSLIKGS